MDWNLDDNRPIWPQIKEKLSRDIVSGKYPPGSTFPTVRDLAEEATVNRNTMQRALSSLEADGLVVTNRTAGRTVTTDNALISEARETLANNLIKDFLSEMNDLGWSKDEAIKLISSSTTQKG